MTTPVLIKVILEDDGTTRDVLALAQGTRGQMARQ